MNTSQPEAVSSRTSSLPRPPMHRLPRPTAASSVSPGVTTTVTTATAAPPLTSSHRSSGFSLPHPPSRPNVLSFSSPPPPVVRVDPTPRRTPPAIVLSYPSTTSSSSTTSTTTASPVPTLSATTVTSRNNTNRLSGAAVATTTTTVVSSTTTVTPLLQPGPRPPPPTPPPSPAVDALSVPPLALPLRVSPSLSTVPEVLEDPDPRLTRPVRPRPPLISSLLPTPSPGAPPVVSEPLPVESVAAHCVSTEPRAGHTTLPSVTTSTVRTVVSSSPVASPRTKRIALDPSLVKTTTTLSSPSLITRTHPAAPSVVASPSTRVEDDAVPNAGYDANQAAVQEDAGTNDTVGAETDPPTTTVATVDSSEPPSEPEINDAQVANDNSFKTNTVPPAETVVPQDDWQEAWDSASQQVYYYNVRDGSTSWERPVPHDMPSVVRESPPDAVLEPERTDHSFVETVPANSSVPVESDVVEEENEIVVVEKETTGSSERLAQDPNVEDSLLEDAVLLAHHDTVVDRATPPDDDVLPDGWHEAVDPNSGQPYYFNLLSGQTSWERPVRPPGGAPERTRAVEETVDRDRPNDTDINADEQHASVAVEEIVHDAVVDDVETIEANDTNNGDTTEALPDDQKESNVSLLPTGWQEYTDPGSGMIYYYNSITNSTTWERPCQESEDIEPERTFQPSVKEVETITQEWNAEDTNQDAPETSLGAIPSASNENNVELPAVDSDAGLSASSQAALETEATVQDRDDSYANEMDITAVYMQSEQQSDEKPTEENSYTAAKEEFLTNGGPGIDFSTEKSVTANMEDFDADQEQVVARSHLPAGWQELVDSDTGQIYFYNSMDQITTWDRPSDTDPHSLSPEHQEFGADQMSHQEQDSLEMKLPEVGADQTSAKMEVDTVRAHQQEESDDFGHDESQAPLPDGWEQVFDPASGEFYYFDRVNDTVTWERPVGSFGERSVMHDDELLVSNEDENLKPQDSILQNDQAAEAYQLDDSSNVVEIFGSDNAKEGGIETTFPQSSEIKVDQSNDDQHDTNDVDATMTNLLELTEVSAAPTGDDGNVHTADVGNVLDNTGIDESLPEGWEALVDPDSGAVYYLNVIDESTTWERPQMDFNVDKDIVSPANMPMESLLQHHDENTFVNETVSVSQYSHLPQQQDGLEELSENVNNFSDPSTTSIENRESSLPPGWIELIDDDSGLPYYYCEVENTTTWEKPASKSSQLYPHLSKPMIEPEIENSFIVDDEPERDEYSETLDIQKFDSKVKSEPLPDNNATAPTTVETLTEDRTKSINVPNGVLNEVDMISQNEAKSNEPAGQADPLNQDKSIMHPDEFPLPDGWEQKTDPETNEFYYVNVDTEIITWIRPLPDEAKAMYNAAADICPLPPEWSEELDSDTGNHYYVRIADGMTSWERPVFEKADQHANECHDDGVLSPANGVEFPNDAAEPESVLEGPGKVAPLPDDWVEVWDSETKRFYYVCESTNESTWDRPFPSNESNGLLKEENGHSNPSFDDLPSGWEELFDSSSGRVYYYNKALDESSWDFPQNFLSSVKDNTADMALLRTRRRANAIATFGFGGRLCCIQQRTDGQSGKVVVHHVATIMSSEEIIVAEHAKQAAGFNGPLKDADDAAVLSYIKNRSKLSQDLLWQLVLATLEANEFYQDDNKKVLKSPERAIVERLLLTSETLGNGDSNKFDGLFKKPDDVGSLNDVQKLLVSGDIEAAALKAELEQHFALSLILASMCGSKEYQRAVGHFAEQVLIPGTPLYTSVVLFSNQFQPPEQMDVKSSLWGNSATELRKTWKNHFAAIVSSRCRGWERFLISLGDHLQQLGEISAAHFCYIFSGCPPASPAQPEARVTLLGCAMNLESLNLMSAESIISYERTEAYEWAKRRGRHFSYLPSLQPFKIAYAALLADYGMLESALKYTQNVFEYFKLPDTAVETNEHFSSLSLATLSGDREHMLSTLISLQTRIMKTKSFSNAEHNHDSITLTNVSHQSAELSETPQTAIKDMSSEESLSRSSFLRIVKEDESQSGARHVPPANNLLLDQYQQQSHQSTSDIPFTPFKESELTSSHLQTPHHSVAPHGVLSGPNSVQTTSTTLNDKTASFDKKPPVAPMSAPANLEQSLSAKKRSLFNFGIKDRMTKWLNPDATKADIGEPMQAYYDDKRKVWVFPGEDPDEKAKPIGPPPKTPYAPAPPTHNPPSVTSDPLMAMMAPPPRTNINRMKSAGPPSNLSPMNTTVNNAVIAPSFSVFKPLKD